MQFFELVELVGAQLNLPQLVPGPRGVCAIRVDGIPITFRHDPASRSFTLSAPVARVDIGDPQVLDALARARMDGPTLAWSVSGEVRLEQRFLLPSLQFRVFFGALQRFVDLAEAWRGRLG